MTTAQTSFPHFLLSYSYLRVRLRGSQGGGNILVQRQLANRKSNQLAGYRLIRTTEKFLTALGLVHFPWGQNVLGKLWSIFKDKEKWFWPAVKQKELIAESGSSYRNVHDQQRSGCRDVMRLVLEHTLGAIKLYRNNLWLLAKEISRQLPYTTSFLMCLSS